MYYPESFHYPYTSNASILQFQEKVETDQLSQDQVALSASTSLPAFDAFSCDCIIVITQEMIPHTQKSILVKNPEGMEFIHTYKSKYNYISLLLFHHFDGYRVLSSV